MFFDVERLVLDAGATAPQDTGGRFHVLNVVEEASVTISTYGADRCDHGRGRGFIFPSPRPMRLPGATGRPLPRTLRTRIIDLEGFRTGYAI
jgi:hypothetical protein